MLRTLNSEYDRLLLLQEIECLRGAGFRFHGETLEKQLGVDAWVLGVGIVEERKSKHKRIESSKRRERST